MGLWLMAEEKIDVVPAVDDRFIREFVEFSIISCPVEYCTEKFANPWYFDSENKLACVSGKFAEPGIWYRHLKKYLFDPGMCFREICRAWDLVPASEKVSF